MESGENGGPRRAIRGNRGAQSDAVRIVDITRGAEIELDLTAFPEAEPAFAYVDDLRCLVEPLQGLVLAGKVTIDDQPDYMWLEGPRTCVLLKASLEARQGSIACFRSRTTGEFCMEVYHLRPDGAAELLFQDDFCFK